LQFKAQMILLIWQALVCTIFFLVFNQEWKEYTKNRMDLVRKVKKTIEDYALIQKGERVVLGLSGGPDSICLLEILFDLKEELGFSLEALHVNHMIRGLEADADEKFLIDYCREKNIPLKVVRADVPAISKKLGKTEEETGRDIRQEELKALGADKIALAHNKNDQAETVLMRIIRGTGVRGLSSMEIKREDGIIRPLLFTDRKEIESFVEERKLPARIDKTNFESEYTRNKIRLELLPKLAEINPNIVDALSRLSESAKGDNEILDAIAEEKKSFNTKDLSQLSDGVFVRVILSMLKDAGLNENVSKVHLNALRSAVLKNVGNKTIEFPKGYKIYLKGGKIEIVKPK